MSGIRWIALTAVLTMTVVMTIHVVQLHQSLREGYAATRARVRQTMPLVGVWQITMGLAIHVVGLGEEGSTAMPTITLIGSGIGVILLDHVARKLKVGVHE